MVYPRTVTHPSTNRAQRRAPTLIKTNALPLSQAATGLIITGEGRCPLCRVCMHLIHVARIQVVSIRIDCYRLHPVSATKLSSIVMIVSTYIRLELVSVYIVSARPRYDDAYKLLVRDTCCIWCKRGQMFARRRFHIDSEVRCEFAVVQKFP